MKVRRSFNGGDTPDWSLFEVNSPSARFQKKEGNMNISIKLTEKEVQEIIKKYVLSEVPVHSTGKEIFVTERYGIWEIEVNDLTLVHLDS